MSQVTRQRRRDVLRDPARVRGKSPGISTTVSRPETLSPSDRHLVPTNHRSKQRSSCSRAVPGFSKAAISSLSTDEQTLVKECLAQNRNNVSEAIQKAFDTALKLRNDCEKESWQVTFRGKKVDLREKTNKVIQMMNRFIWVGDIVANVDPLHIGLPWAIIRIIMKVALSKDSQMATLIEGMELAMSMVGRVQSYLEFRARLPDTPTALTFQKALVKMYVMIMQFFESAMATYQKNRTARVKAALWAESELTGFDKKCKDQAAQVSLDAANCDRELSQKDRDDTKRLWKDLTNAVSGVLTIQLNGRYRQIVEWLSPPDPQYNHRAACKKRTPETCDWVLRSPEYRDWKDTSTCGSLLWLTGKAGCGKTVLCSAVIEDIRSQLQSTPDRNALLDKMGRLYNLHHPNRPPPEVLEDVVSAYMQKHQTFLVMDALDELPEFDDDGRPAVTMWLSNIVKSSHPVKVFITGRHLVSIEDTLKPLGARCVLVHSGAIDNDIQKYVTKEMERDSKLCTFSVDAKERIKNVFQQESDGMFRWAFCQLQELKRLKLTGPKHIEQTLHSLPRSLDETYERMLLQIDDSCFNEALRALRWLTFVSKPLNLGELAEACLIDPTSELLAGADGRGRVDGILDLLTGLVIIDKPEHMINKNSDGESQVDSNELESQGSNTPSRDDLTAADPLQVRSDTSRVRLAHFSVREYLMSERILGHGTVSRFALERHRDRQILAQICLAYLLSYSKSPLKAKSRRDLDVFPFLRYAAKNWAKFISKDELIEPAYELTLLPSKEHTRDWLSICNPETPRKSAFKQLQLDTGSALYYAALLGLVSAARSLTGQGADVNAQGGRYGNALQAASFSGHDGMVKLLLENGADVDAQGGIYGNALQAASLLGHQGIVELLLENGANVNAQGGEYSHALQAASLLNYQGIVKLLLNNGADVNAQGGIYGSALQAASLLGSQEVVKLLLDNGAKIRAGGRLRQCSPGGISSRLLGGVEDVTKSRRKH